MRANTAQQFLRGALGSALLLAGSGCTFPSYVVRADGAGGQMASGQAGADPVGGAAGSAGSLSMAGSPALGGAPTLGGAGGASGTGGSTMDPGTVLDWSAASLEQLGFALLGSAKLAPDGVAITQKDVKNKLGGLVQKQQLDFDLQPDFEVVLGFRIDAGAMNGDGLAIVLHASPDGYGRLGGGGGGLAYAGISPCVAIELDTAEVAAADLPAPHLGLMPDCNPDQHGPSTTALGGDPSDGGDWTLAVSWSSQTGLLQVTLRTEATGRETQLSEPMDLTTLVGPKLYVAVTAATGEFTATHLISSLHLRGGGLAPRTLQGASN